MIKDFDYKKALKFLQETRQPILIIQGARNINELDLQFLIKYTISKTDSFELSAMLRYYEEEQLYCKLLKENNYYLPFTFFDLRYCFAKIHKVLQNHRIDSKKYRHIKELLLVNDKAFDLIDSILHSTPGGSKSLGERC